METVWSITHKRLLFAGEHWTNRGTCARWNKMAASSPVMSMAPPSIAAADAPQRPSMMRRKSSAQNLLSSFKVPAPPPAGVPQPQPATTTSAASTPTHTSMPREWDVQSLQSDAAPPAVPNGAAVQGTSVEILRELVRKRIITLTYMRNVHEGCARSPSTLPCFAHRCPWVVHAQEEPLVPHHHGYTRGARPRVPE